MSMNLLIKTIDTAYQFPGVQINRDEFLKECFKNYYTNDKVDKIIKTSPVQVGVSDILLEKIAKEQISSELNKVSLLSASCGAINIGGIFTVAGAATADLSQYFSHCLRLCQKLAYIYGWPNLNSVEDMYCKIDDNNVRKAEFILLGAMFGAKSANKFIANMAAKCVNNYTGVKGFFTMISPPLWYTAIKEIGGVLGVTVSKEFAKRSVSKVAPILGAAVSGGITYITFSSAAENLHCTLKANPMKYVEVNEIE